MAKLTRVLQKVFGSTAAGSEISKFGSLAAGTPEFTTDPLAVQSYSNFLGGWFSGVLGNNSPAIEDMNALCFLFSRQIAYLMQTGIPEWDATTTYYIGSVASSSTGVAYISITDNNLNNALTDTANWKVQGIRKRYVVKTSGTGTYTPTSGTIYAEVEAVGGGGGGSSGGGGSASPSAGGTGGSTLFGSIITAAGGVGAATSGVGGAGGAVSIGAGCTQVAAIAGGSGGSCSGTIFNVAGSPVGAFGGASGAGSHFGGAGGGAGNNGSGSAATANSGSGGGGGGCNAIVDNHGGGGGGAGGYAKVLIEQADLAASYSFTVGAAGAAGGAVTNGGAGAAGGTGIIIIAEYYR